MDYEKIPVWLLVLAAVAHPADQAFESIEEAVEEIVPEGMKTEVWDKIEEAEREAEKDPRTPIPSPEGE